MPQKSPRLLNVERRPGQIARASAAFHDPPRPFVPEQARVASVQAMYGASTTSPGEKATSSRAVLAALRALQDKIARLEGERQEAVNGNKELRHTLREAELRLESSREVRRTTGVRVLF